MAEEIVGGWETADALLIELIGDGKYRKTRVGLRLEDFGQGLIASPRTRLVDGNGNIVEFPVQMVSDWKFRSE